MPSLIRNLLSFLPWYLLTLLSAFLHYRTCRDSAVFLATFSHIIMTFHWFINSFFMLGPSVKVFKIHSSSKPTLYPNITINKIIFVLVVVAIIMSWMELLKRRKLIPTCLFIVLISYLLITFSPIKLLPTDVPDIDVFLDSFTKYLAMPLFCIGWLVYFLRTVELYSFWVWLSFVPQCHYFIGFLLDVFAMFVQKSGLITSREYLLLLNDPATTSYFSIGGFFVLSSGLIMDWCRRSQLAVCKSLASTPQKSTKPQSLSVSSLRSESSEPHESRSSDSDVDVGDIEKDENKNKMPLEVPVEPLNDSKSKAKFAPRLRLQTTRSQTFFASRETERSFDDNTKKCFKEAAVNTSHRFSIPQQLGPISKSLDIIILSSDEEHIKQMKQMSEKLGHRCIVTDSIQECKRLVESTSHGVLFFDVTLRDGSGLELLNLFRTTNQKRSLANPQGSKLPKSYRLPVPAVAFICEERPEEKQDLLRAGILDYLTKPITALTLDKILREIITKETTTEQAAKMIASISGSDLFNKTGSVLQTSHSSSSSSSSSSLKSNLSSDLTNQNVESTEACRTLLLTEEPQNSPNNYFSEAPVTSVSDNEISLSTEAKLRRQLESLQKTFDSFVPPQFQQLIAPSGTVRLGDTICRSITIMFTDIRDFTAMSEKMYINDLMQFLNTYLAFAMPPITEFGGFVDKFIGDSIMCIFAHHDLCEQATAAVNCAIKIMRNLDFMVESGFHSCETGIGINTGRTIIGIIGTETRMAPTALGDAVNLASRTESLSKRYGARILITEFTKDKMGENVNQVFTLRQVDNVQVKGKSKPCKLYEVIEGERPEIQRLKQSIMEDYNMGIAAFTTKKFDEARTYFHKCLEVFPGDIPSKLYFERCGELLKKTQSDLVNWTDVHRLTEKY
jgi:class 3 adenylate cyclase/DNA-binding response OmpR family regulator